MGKECDGVDWRLYCWLDLSSRPLCEKSVWKKIEMFTGVQRKEGDAGSQRMNGCWSLGQREKKKKKKVVGKEPETESDRGKGKVTSEGEDEDSYSYSYS